MLYSRQRRAFQCGGRSRSVGPAATPCRACSQLQSRLRGPLVLCCKVGADRHSELQGHINTQQAEHPRRTGCREAGKGAGSVFKVCGHSRHAQLLQKAWTSLLRVDTASTPGAACCTARSPAEAKALPFYLKARGARSESSPRRAVLKLRSFMTRVVCRCYILRVMLALHVTRAEPNIKLFTFGTTRQRLLSSCVKSNLLIACYIAVSEPLTIRH